MDVLRRLIRTAFPRVEHSSGLYSGLLLCALLSSAAWGAAWARLRPTLVGHAVEGGYSIDPANNAQFTGLAGALGGAVVISIALGLFAYLRGGSQRGIGTQLWVGLCAFSAMGTVVLFSHVLAPGVPKELVDTVRFAPGFDPGMGWLLAPFLAMFTYWSACFVSSDKDWEPESESAKAVAVPREEA